MPALGRAQKAAGPRSTDADGALVLKPWHHERGAFGLSASQYLQRPSTTSTISSPPAASAACAVRAAIAASERSDPAAPRTHTASHPPPPTPNLHPTLRLPGTGFEHLSTRPPAVTPAAARAHVPSAQPCAGAPAGGHAEVPLAGSTRHGKVCTLCRRYCAPRTSFLT